MVDEALPLFVDVIVNCVPVVSELLVVTYVSKLLLEKTEVLVSVLEAVVNEALPVAVPVVEVLPVQVTAVTELVEYCDVG